MARPALLEPEFLARLERLRIEARRAFPGATKGERRSPNLGSSAEFADFREYAPGDDLRRLDWNAYARLDRLMLRLFVEEEDVRVDLLVDTTRSMSFGEPETKLLYAKRVAAALAYLAVASLDRVGAAGFAARLGPRLRAVRGRGQLVTLLKYLDSLAPVAEGEPSSLGAALDRYSRETARPGIVFVLSDFFDTSPFVRAIERLALRGFDVNLLQILTPEEERPSLEGDLLLVDSETGDAREITASKGALAAYQRALDEHRAKLEALGPSAGVRFAAVTTDVPFDEFVLRGMRSGRMLGAS